MEEGMEEVWKRVPNLRQRMVAEYGVSLTPLFSFTGAPPAPSGLQLGTFCIGLSKIY